MELSFESTDFCPLVMLIWHLCSWRFMDALLPWLHPFRHNFQSLNQGSFFFLFNIRLWFFFFFAGFGDSDVLCWNNDFLSPFLLVVDLGNISSIGLLDSGMGTSALSSTPQKTHIPQTETKEVIKDANASITQGVSLSLDIS